MSHYLPTLCDSCQRVTLTALSALGSGQQACGTCGSPLRVVPSCSYKQSEAALFAELSQVVADGGVEPEEAQAFASESMHALVTGALKECSDTLAVRLPGLLPFQLVTGSNVAVQRAALQMLRTIFEALATLRRPSRIQELGTHEEARRLA